MNYLIREMQKHEYTLLNDFLYEAIFQRDENHLAPRTIINNPALQVYIKDFGTMKDDYCLCAEVEKKGGVILIEQLCDDGGGCLHMCEQLRCRSRPILLIPQERYQPKKDRRHSFFGKLLLPFAFHQFPAALTETEGKLLIFNIPADTKQLCGIGSPCFLFQNKGGIRTSCQPCCARHLIEHIAVVLLADIDLV